MEGRLEDDVVRVGGDARQRYYDSRGFGRPVDGGLELAPVEAAYLLFRGDLDAVDGMAFHDFFSAVDLDIAFLVYKDLRDRGFYLSPARDGWVDGAGAARDDVDLVVYPRGKGPWDDAVQYRVRVVDERGTVPAADLGDVVLAVVDEESEITYLETDRPTLEGSSTVDLPREAEGTVSGGRVLLRDPPAALYERGFFGRPLDGREGDGPLHLSLVEAAYLVARGVVEVDGGLHAVLERGRAVEGDRFDRRRRVYEALRDRGTVPKTGFKFGADFRVYGDVDSVDDLGHSETLVRVLEPGHAFDPRDLSLDVRLAGGVRKRMVFALTGANGNIDWLSVARLTP